MENNPQPAPGQPQIDLNLLRRHPDVEAGNLFAHDATDELLLQEAHAALAAAEGPDVVVVGDRYGALTLGAAAVHGLPGIRVHQDGLSGERALENNAAQLLPGCSYIRPPLGAELFAGAKVVLWQLPRGLEELAELAGLMAAHAAPDVQLFAGGRVKHMTLAMNAVLGKHFAQVEAGRAWRKSRPLRASGPLGGDGPREEVPASDFPKREFHPDLNLWLCAHGATFGGTRVDVGTRFLLDHLADMRPDAGTAIDLGCGNGTIAAALAASRPQLRVVATDQSASAVASTQATLEANGLTGQVAVSRDDALAGFDAQSAELIVLNPPFHVGATVHAGIAHKLFAAAARVLAPGGELWCVYNRHLDYEGALRAVVGPTRTVAKNSKFTLTKSIKSAP